LTLPSRPPLVRRALAALVGIVALVAGMVTGAAPAGASTCATPGHAYLTQPGELYFSGFDGNQQFGVPTFNTFRGDTFQVGGNGIAPFFNIQFRAMNTATGAFVDLFSTGDAEFGFVTATAFDNCVVHESGAFTLNLPDGRYRLVAQYLSGNLGTQVVDQVVDVVVRTPLPPPPPPRDPCLRICTA
jgi:hypothetical protein